MFIIFGWGKKTVQNYGSTFPMICGNCNNSVYSNLVQVRLWFTIFFIPIIPYKSKFHLICNTCSRGTELMGDDVKKAKHYNIITKSYINKEITEEKYSAFLNSPEGFIESKNPNDNWECPRCSKSSANTTYSCQHCGYRIV